MDTSTPPAPTQAYFNELGYPDQPQSALIATDFPGLGLPYYLWYQLANLLYKVDASFDLELNCHDQVGGICSLNQACSQYTNLWNNGWAFKIEFTGSSNYALFPLSALAVDNANTGQCDVFIQYLDARTYTQSDSVIFGTLFLQQFATLETYDLTAGTSSLSMYISDSCTLPNIYVGGASYAPAADPFTMLHGTSQQVFINADEFHYQTTIGSSLGFQERTQFKVSLLGQYIYAYDTQCLIKQSGTMFASCEEAPVYA